MKPEADWAAWEEKTDEFLEGAFADWLEAREALEQLGMELAKDPEYDRSELKRFLLSVCFAHLIKDLDTLRRKAKTDAEPGESHARGGRLSRGEVEPKRKAVFRWKAFDRSIQHAFFGMSEESFRGFGRRLEKLATEIQQVNRSLAASPVKWIPELSNFLPDEKRPKGLAEANLCALLPDLLRLYGRVARIRERSTRAQFSAKTSLATDQELRLFIYVEHFCGKLRESHFEKVSLVLQAIYLAMLPPTVNGEQPALGADALKRRYARRMKSAQKRLPALLSSGGPLDAMVKFWRDAILETLGPEPKDRKPHGRRKAAKNSR